MGVVYKAEDTKLKRLVALKFLPPELSRDGEAKERFVQEAQAASALDHPNICTIYEIGEADDEQIFIAMAYYEGETLKKKIAGADGGPSLPVDLIIEIAIQMAQGLAKAHEKGIVHRDIKPANVMITKDGLVKIVDFGLALLAGLPRLTKTGSTVGTMAYMSPEQARGEQVDHRTDIWALGVVLYEMLTGQLPFKGEYEHAVLYAVLKGDLQPIMDSRSDVSRELEAIVHKALAKNPDERFQRMEEMLKDMRAHKAESTPPSHSAQRRTSHQPQFIKYLIAAAIILAAGAAGLMWHQLSSTSGDTTSTPAQVTPLTRYLGYECHPSFSPDGNLIAFTWNGAREDNYDIYAKIIGTESISRLTTDPEPDYQATWSPDGRAMAFLRQLSVDKAGVYLMPALGGPARKLAETHLVNHWPIFWRTTNLAWHPQGRWLLVSDKSSPEEPFELFLISMETGEKTKMLSSSVNFPPGGDFPVAFSQDGRKVVFVRQAAEYVGDLHSLELADDLSPLGEPKRLTIGESFVMDAVITPDGKEVIYQSADAISRIALAGPPKSKPIIYQREIKSIALSRQGHHLAYSQQFLVWNIWRIQLSDTLSVNPRPLRLISSTSIDHAPQYSPDGQKVAFTSERSGTSEIWVCDSDGSNSLQLTAVEGAESGTPRWSPDGQSIVFDLRQEGQNDIYIMNADGGAPRRLTTYPADEIVPSWSRSGHQIYFTSLRSGKYQIWKIKPDGSEGMQVTQDGGFAALDSPDGRYLYYAKDLANPTSLWRVPAETGEEKQLIDKLSYWCNFAVVADGVYFIPSRDTDSEEKDRVLYLNFADGKIKTIATLEKPASAGLAVSPDRRFLLYTQLDQEGMDLFLMENFQ
ncbi:MAG: protein kinase domain-containing protein [bacterium]